MSGREIIEAFSKSLPEYLRDVENMSGKLFYSITWNQIEEHLAKEKQLRILDVGCGFGLTSIWFSEQGHHVTGIDITPDMIETAQQKAKEKQLNITFKVGQMEQIEAIVQGESFDWVICHNVLGYVDEPIRAFEKLLSLLNPGGYLSIITHNPAAKVLKKAIVERDVVSAKDMIDQQKEYNPLIGTYMEQYSLETYQTWFKQMDLNLVQQYGLRCVFDYFQEETEQELELADLLSLELTLGKLRPYKDISFFTHFICQKP